MFTGIVEEVGSVRSVRRQGNALQIAIDARTVLTDAKVGDSICVNGICLTVTSRTENTFTADVMYETVSRTSLKGVSAGTRVNLERAMPLNGRFGGHIVSGHIDGTGTVTEIRNDGIAVWYTIQAEPSIMRYIVEKGSIAIDGISLTVARVTKDTFAVSVIPHTIQNTILPFKKKGDPVNLENDVVGKYVEKLLGGDTQTVMDVTAPAKAAPSGGITRDFLYRTGGI
ncbi:MAG: riboflavin synthase [Clostridiales bacterium]|nr:riboflavin synthase [Clostridiales bacterium]